MKQLKTISQRSPNDVFACTSPAPNGMHNQYWIAGKGIWKLINENRLSRVRLNAKSSGDIYFANEYANDPGVTESDLLEIVRDRLIDFQAGASACPQVAEALGYVTSALEALNRMDV